MPITSGVNAFLGFFIISAICAAGIAYALQQGMELLGRLAAVVGISLALTLLLLVLYQDDGAGANSDEPVPAITASATASGHDGTP
jgi:hypothetical protein